MRHGQAMQGEPQVALELVADAVSQNLKKQSGNVRISAAYNVIHNSLILKFRQCLSRCFQNHAQVET